MDRKDSRKTRVRTVARFEAMEERTCLTGGVGNTFALMAGSIAKAGESVEVRFTLDPASFQRANGRAVIGVDVTPQKDSTVAPKIGAVNPVTAQPTQSPAGRRFNRSLPTTRNRNATAVLTTFNTPRGQTVNRQDLSVTVSGMRNTTGDLIVGFYLPGDADGNGQVNQADTDAVRKLIGTTVKHTDYSFDADANRDGVINGIDLNYTRINKGVKTTISPVLTANLDPAYDTGNADRITSVSKVKFTGQASPGASITFQEVAGRTPNFTAVADAAGNYVMDVTLAPGVNTYRVTSIDNFGQVISGQISPVILQTT